MVGKCGRVSLHTGWQVEREGRGRVWRRDGGSSDLPPPAGPPDPLSYEFIHSQSNYNLRDPTGR